MKEIYLTQGRVALVDDEDYEYLSQFSWRFDSGYAKTSIGKPQSTISMNRLLLQPEKGLVTDHINHNMLDNRKSNLRICSPSENGKNKSKSKNNTTGYKGVDKVGRKWRAQIKCDGKKIHLGMFSSAEDAHNEYKKASHKLFGNFALLD